MRMTLSRAGVILAAAALMAGPISLAMAPQAAATSCTTTARVASVKTTYIEASGVAGSMFCLVGPSLRFYGTRGAVKINGITLLPTNGTWIIIDRDLQRVTTYDASDAIGGTVEASLPITSSVSIPMGTLEQIRECMPSGPGGRLECTTRPGISWDFLASSSNQIRVDTYTTPAGLKIAGLPVRGSLQVRLAQKRAIVALYLQLPNWFSSSPDSSEPITGKASVSITNAGSAKFEGAEVNVPSAYFGSVEISKLSLSYSAVEPKFPNGLWKGTFILTGLPGGGKLEACCDKPYGIAFSPPLTFDYAGAKYTFGTPLPLSSGAYLASIDAAFHRDPTTIIGKAKLLFGPSADAPAVGIDAAAMVAWGTSAHPAQLSDINPSDTRSFDDFTVYTTGTARLFDKVEFAKAKLLYVYPAYVDLEGKLDYDIKGALRLSANAKATFNFDTWDYYVSAGAKLCTGSASWIPYWARDECAGGDFVLSSKGIGGCIRWAGPDVGGYYKWNGDLRFFFYGCDVSGALAVDVTRSRSPMGRESVAPLVVSEGEEGLLVAVKAERGLPAFSIASPTGRVIRIPGADAAASYTLPRDVRIMYSPLRERTVYVAIDNPTPGTWRILPLKGSPSIASVSRAQLLPEPSVTADIGVQGRSGYVSYDIAALPGQRVEFTIKGEGVSTTVGTDRGQGGQGSFSFTTDDGPAGTRQVFAVVKSYDTVRRVIPIGSFDSPGPDLPPAPAVSVYRDQSTPTNVVATWTAGTSRDRAIVVVSTSDGRVVRYTPGRNSLTIPDIDEGLSGSVTVRFIRDKRMLGPDSTTGFGPT